MRRRVDRENPVCRCDTPQAAPTGREQSALPGMFQGPDYQIRDSLRIAIVSASEADVDRRRPRLEKVSECRRRLPRQAVVKKPVAGEVVIRVPIGWLGNDERTVTKQFELAPKFVWRGAK